MIIKTGLFQFFGVTALTLAYGGVNEGRAFALAFAAGAAFAAFAVATAFGIEARRIVLAPGLASEARE